MVYDGSGALGSFKSAGDHGDISIIVNYEPVEEEKRQKEREEKLGFQTREDDVRGFFAVYTHLCGWTTLCFVFYCT